MSRGNRSDQRRERTEEERERARRERALRRAAEQGEPPQEPPADLIPDAGDTPPAGAMDTPMADAGDTPPAGARDAPMAATAERSAAGLAASSDLPARPVRAEPAQPPWEPQPPPGQDEPPLPPPPPRPVIPPAAGPRRGGSRRALARAGAVVALAAVLVVLWLIVHPLLRSGHTVTIPPPAAVKVLVPEGKTRLQIAQIATADGLTGSYRAATRRSALLNPADYGAPASTPDLEGFLFPDTFDIDRNAPVTQLVEAQLTDFRSKFGKSQVDAARALHVTPYGLLTVASMVEREALIPKDRPLIAAVIYNRLRAGMPLGIDATIYYAVELKSGIATYTKELTESQLHIDSPYNTRLHIGLPPTPVSNPGLASIEAAAHPAHVPYLYYVAGADGCGEQVFSTSEAQFEVDAQAYHAAVARNGGRPPTCRKK